jgi:hypothetical protein
LSRSFAVPAGGRRHSILSAPLLLGHCCIQRSAHSSWSHLPAQKPRGRARMPGLSWFSAGIAEPALLL